MPDDVTARPVHPDAEPPLDWWQLADALWLAAFLPPDGPDAADDQEPDPDGDLRGLFPTATSRGDAGEGPVPAEAVHGARPSDDHPHPPPPRSELSLPGGPGGGRSGAPVRVPTAPALPNALGLTRALRPLRGPDPSPRFAARRRLELDEEATVENIAGTGLWLPVLGPAPARWLDLALVVDDSVSMVVWDRAVKEFRSLLENAGAFRSVQQWTLPTEEFGSGGVVLRAGGGSVAGGGDRSPLELVDPTGRRVVLVVSDCISPSWSDGTLARLLRLWGRSGPVAIVQPLPRRMWERTRMDLRSVRLRSSGPGTPNGRLRIRSLRDDGSPPDGLPVPMLELDPRFLGPWASLTSGEITELPAWVALVDPQLPPHPRPDDGSGADPPGDLSPAETVAQFRSTASPDAYRLALYLSAAPLSMPVMRLVQAALVSDPRPSQLAEVLLGGLLTRSADSEGARGDDVMLEFREGIRDELLLGIGGTTAIRVLEIVSRHVSERSGSRVDFAAVLSGDITAVARLREERPFALVSAQVLRRLSGTYEEIAAGLERSGGAVAVPSVEAPAETRLVLGSPPPRAVELFGREKQLQELRAALGSGAKPQVLVAAEGSGATALAVEYLHEHADAYEVVLWLSADRPAAAGPGPAQLSEEIRRRADEGGAVPSWLVVLDGARARDGLPPLPDGPGAILVTSADSDWPEEFTVHRLPGLARGKGIRLVRRIAPDLAPSQAGRLSTRLDDVPLALELAATFLSVSGTPLPAYLDALGPGTGPAVSRSPDPTSSSVPEGDLAARPARDPAAEVCRLAVDRVVKDMPSARGVLDLLAVLAPGPVPRSLLTGVVPPVGSTADPAAAPVLDLLRRYALLRIHAPADELAHTPAVLRRVCRERMTDDELATARRTVRARLVLHAGPDLAAKPAAWPRLAALTRHLDPVGALGDKDPEVRRLVLGQVRFLRACGDTAGSRALGALALRRLASRAGAGHHGVAELASLVADVLADLGEHTEAARLREDTKGWLRDLPAEEPAGS
ncbi:SAV_2336 N-terminal domain-related protein [Streptomyces sp. SID1121]|uniref:SAV_2336 N-terminal domain-related protein n=1 Tax=Streptomyces sp. SID1121 TaxID=3425888 RepID=UPI004055D9DC